MQLSSLLTRHPASGHWADPQLPARAPREATRDAQPEMSDGTISDLTLSVRRKIPLAVTGAALMMVVVSALVWHFAL
jgi:hypothetical protein